MLALESGKFYPVTLKSVNPLNFSSQKSKIDFLKTALTNFKNPTSNESGTCKLQTKRLINYYDSFLMMIRFRDRSTSHATPGIWVFVTVVIDFSTENFFPGVTRILDLQLRLLLLYTFSSIYVPMCLCNPLDTEGRLDVYKTFKTLTFKLTSCVLGVILNFF